jgi:hypothetical protein
MTFVEERSSRTVLVLWMGNTLNQNADSGSLYYNYKRFFSILLLTLVDANYSFYSKKCWSSWKVWRLQCFLEFKHWKEIGIELTGNRREQAIA